MRLTEPELVNAAQVWLFATRAWLSVLDGQEACDR
jgi:hypothetical protein